MRRTKPRTLSTVVKGLAVASVALMVPFTGIAATASADPVVDNEAPLSTATSPNGSKVTKIEVKNGRELTMYVYSASMQREIPLDVLRPADTSVPRPTLYMLNGAGGGEDAATWRARTDAYDFFGDKNINVVSPIGGKWSYYADWKQPDPVLGVNLWKTFMTEEIPPLVDAALGTNGVNSLAGLSSSGTSVLQLSIAKPGLYGAVAAYSGCAQISDPIGQTFVKQVVELYGGGSTLNLYGPDNDPMWAQNDPYVNAEGLRGTGLYISNGTGLPGIYDNLNGPDIKGKVPTLANQIIIGGVIEAATNYCSHNLQNKLNQLGIPATYNFRDGGTHSWGYWGDDLKNSWPVLARGLGI